MRPPDMPPAERFAHGTNARYVAGCRCETCRLASRAYETARRAAIRAGTWEFNPFVSAKPAQRHIRQLQRRGIGKKSIANFSGVAYSTIDYVRSGAKKTLRAKTAKRILAVDASCALPGTRVPIAETLKRVDWLLSEGFTKSDLARRLGYSSPSLQFLYRHAGTVTAETADLVERLYRQFHEEAA